MLLSFARLARSALAWPLACGLLLGLPWSGHAQQRAVAVVKPPSKEPPKLRETEEKALRTFIEKLTEAKRRLYLEEMKELAGSVGTETGLDARAVEALQEGIEPAVDAAMQGWADKAYAWLAPFVGRSGNAVRDMARWPVEQIARSPGVKDVRAPDEQPLWLDFLRARLSPAQWQVWQDKLAREARELEQRATEHVQFTAENQRPMLELEMALAKADVIHLLALAPERKERVEELARQTVDATLGAWQEAALKALREMDRERREAVITHGGGIAIEEEFRPTEQAVWKEGIAALLSADEQDRMQAALEARLIRRKQAASLAVLQLIDERAALSADQRARLLPLLDEVATKLTELMRRYYNLDPSLVGLQLSQCDLKAVRAVLDPAQQRGLDRLLRPANQDHGDEDALAEADKLPPPATEEDLERLLSENLLRRYDDARTERLADMESHLEDLRRHARLTPDQQQTLELAMHGAVQDSLALFRQQVSSWLRQSISGATGALVRQRLIQLGTAGFGNEVPPKDTDFWLATLERVLGPVQREAWLQAQAEREQELRRAQVLLVVSELEHQLALSAEQVAFFEPKIADLIAQYADDLDDYRGARRWHLHAYSMLTPVAGIPEAELKKHLTPAQLELWMEKAENQVRHYWEGVKRNHDNRLRLNKEGDS